MKKQILLFLAMLMPLMASAYDAQIDGIYYNLNADTKQATVTSGDTYFTGSVSIPETVTYNDVTYSVTSIGYDAFYNCYNLTSITIPNSVTSIGDYAFCYCEGLTSVIIGNNVTSIGTRAFYYCSGLKSIIIPNSVTSIGYYAFRYCYSLTSITIPNSVTSIGENAFYNCSNLTTIELNSNAIISNSYSSSSSLKNVFGEQVKEYIIGDDVTSIGSCAFYNCSSLTSVAISNNVTKIGSDAFGNCLNLTRVELNSNAIISKSYSSSLSLKNVFGEQVKEYIIGNDVTSIGDNAFYGYSGLTSIAIPNNVTDIGSDAFGNCLNLTKVELNSNAIASKSYSSSLSLKNVFGEQIKEYIIGDDVTSIGNYAFHSYYNLTSVTIPNSVKSIGSSAFSDCYFVQQNFINNSSLDAETNNYWGASIVDSRENECAIKDGVLIKYIGNETSVTIPGIVTSIGNSAFSDCSGLKSVTIPDHVKSIGKNAFKACSGLTYVYCDAMNVPMTDGKAFDNTDVSNATLYVASISVVDAYKTTAPWSGFGTISPRSYVKIANEGELTQNISYYTTDKCVISPKTIDDARVSQRGYLQILPVKTNGTWDVTYNIEGVVPGKYNVHVVTLPKTMVNEAAKNLPVKYKMKLLCGNQDGQEKETDCGAFASTADEITDNVADSVEISGKYVKITLSGNASARRAPTETSEMYLDYIYLEPVYPDESEAEEVTFPDITIDDTNFPDENFRNWILSQNYGSDGVLTSKEIAGIRNINVSGKNIQSLKGIEYFYALLYLDCCTNQLTSLDVSQNSMLTSLYCYGNQLTSLDVSNNTALNSLSCGDNQLSSLNVSGCTALKYLYCPDNQLYSLDVSENTLLTWLGCYNNPLTSLDLSKNTLLESLQCNGNQLTSLDLSKNTALEDLSCYGNQIKIEGMDALAASLPNVNNGTMRVIYNENEGNVMTNTHVAVAKEKGWTPQYYNNGWVEYDGVIGIDETNFPDENFRNWILSQSYGSDRVMTSDEIAVVTSIDVSGKDIQRLKGVEFFTVLTELYCYNNPIKYSAMNELVECLPIVRNGRMYVINNTSSDDAMTTSQVEAAWAKGWTPMSNMNNEVYSGCDPRGDTDGDYKVNMSDVMYVVNYILGKSTEAFVEEFADVNGDGEINMTDVMFTVWKINNGKYPDEEACFYLGTTKPTAKNYLSLPGVVTSYSSIEEALETTTSVSAGETLYLLCPTSWMRGREVVLKDGNGENTYFSDEIDYETVSEHSIYKTQVFDASMRFKLENMYLPDLMEKDPTISIFSQALKLTNMDDTLKKYIDDTYSVGIDSVTTGVPGIRFGGKNMTAYYKEKRYFKYTAFVETDEILSRSGINSLEDLIAHAKAVYDKTFPYDAGLYDGDYTNRKNPLNRWVSYHLMNRYGNYSDWAPYGEIYTDCCRPDVADAEDFWQTMLNEGMIRFCRAVGQLYANRKGLKNEVSEGQEGVRVLTDYESGNVNQQALNGRYFYLDNLLEYSTDVRDKALNCRMRIDATTLSADFMNQGSRGNLGWEENYLFAHKRGYIEGWKISPETFVGVHCDNPWWSSYLGNAVAVKGQYDVQIKLPNPPPGIYEIRLAYVASEERGVVQVYLNNEPCGSPVDMREYAWTILNRDDYDLNTEEGNDAIDRDLRNLGYMLGPDSYGKPGATSFRVDAPEHMRRILTTAYFPEGKESWLRFRQILEGNAEWSFDYIELCPKSVYDSEEGEDRH